MTNQEKSNLQFLISFVLYCTLVCLLTHILSFIITGFEIVEPFIDITCIAIYWLRHKNKFLEIIGHSND
jgi:hypothetical protein